MQENSNYRVFITGSGIAAHALQILESENCVYEIGTPNDSPQEIADKLKAFNPDALIVRQGKITGEALNTATNLKVICKHGVGTDNIDIEAASRVGIPVFYTPNANHEAVAVHTLALLLSLIRQIPAQDKRIRNGVFDKSTYGGQELAGKTLGLIGFGKVGRRLSELVAPFRMQIIAYHPSNIDEVLPNYITKTGNINKVFMQADVVSLHCPLTPDTHNLLNTETFNLMKRGAYIINTARGGIVNESDLLLAIKDKKIGGAALDVFEVEPPPTEGNPLFQLENVILSPHIAGTSDNSLENMGLEAVKHILSILKGEPVDTDSMKNRVSLKM